MEPLVTITLKEYEELKSREKPKEDCMLLKEIKRWFVSANLGEDALEKCLNEPKRFFAEKVVLDDISQPIYMGRRKINKVRIEFNYDNPE